MNKFIPELANLANGMVAAGDKVAAKACADAITEIERLEKNYNALLKRFAGYVRLAHVDADRMAELEKRWGGMEVAVAVVRLAGRVDDLENTLQHTGKQLGVERARLMARKKESIRLKTEIADAEDRERALRTALARIANNELAGKRADGERQTPGEKLQLPPEGELYERAMKRSGEIKADAEGCDDA